MKLFEHDDFEAAITATASARGVEEPFVEKDYYITEVLRLVSEKYGDRVIFKGGTSLSKGWGLIERLSEDIDLLVVRDRFLPRLSRTKTDHELEKMKDLVAAYPGLSWSSDKSETFGGARRDVFTFNQRFETVGLPNTVQTEPGVAGGDHPTEDMDIGSVVASYLREQGEEEIADDLNVFQVTTLHFRRTFVEKLFVIHALAERLKDEGIAFGRDARHYYDIHRLVGEDEVITMLASNECQQIKKSCEEIGLKFFKSQYRGPPELDFSKSDGLFPSAELRAQIEPDYEAQCELLCYGDYPPFGEVLGRLEDVRALL
ncbi:MAG: nucleotidyl transferase AbiEii/AbiGii toxin family protein [Thermoleophilaceae bacterium]